MYKQLLGNDHFVEAHLALLKEQSSDLFEIPKKQRRKKVLLLAEYEQLHANRDDAIRAAYSSGGYKDIGEYFKLPYSRVSRIVANNKT